ncbi:hypothetical protein ACQY0O_005125 [Thecaphora frezii]
MAITVSPTTLLSKATALLPASLHRPSRLPSSAPRPGDRRAASSRIRSSLSSSIGAVRPPSRSTLLFLLGCLGWYTSSALSSNLAKALLSLPAPLKALPPSQRPSPPFPYPVTLTLLQFVFIHIFSGLCGSKRVLGPYTITRIVAPSWKRVREVGQISIFNVLGHILSSLAISRVPVATVHTIKALSPLFTVLSYAYLFGATYSARTYLSLAPLTLGVMMACTGLAFDAEDVVGFAAALGSTGIFVAQNIYSKKLLRKSQGTASSVSSGGGGGDDGDRVKMDKLNILFYSSGCSVVLMLPVVLYYDAPVLWHASGGNPSTSTALATSTLVLGNGVVNFSQNLLAFSILSLVSPVTYSIASLFKRVFVILVAIVWFRQHVTGLQMFGIVLTFGGLYLYNDAKVGEERDKAEKKRRKSEREEPVGLLPLAREGPRMVNVRPAPWEKRKGERQRGAWMGNGGGGGGLPSPPYSDKE